MAEIAAGAIAAEEVVSTTIQGGAVAGYALAQPTLPLKASFKRIGATDASDPFLALSHHTLTHHAGNLYLFGGLASPTTLATNETHIFSQKAAAPPYRAIPAIASAGNPALTSPDGQTNPDPGPAPEAPSPRAAHSASIINNSLAVYGGFSDARARQPLQEAGRVHLLDLDSLTWSQLVPKSTTYPTTHSHTTCAWNNALVLHGGTAAQTWILDIPSRTWSLLSEPEPSAPATDAAFAVSGDTAYLLSWPDQLTARVHTLSLADTAAGWTTCTLPTNPLTPGPRPRHGAPLVPITTGQGRTYLLLILGARAGADAHEFFSAIWALQIPSRDTSAAKLKDATREQVGASSHAMEWAEVQVQAAEETDAQGKAHPGPRGYFGCDVLEGNKVALWGGQDASGAAIGDGWVVQVTGPSPLGLFKRGE